MRSTATCDAKWRTSIADAAVQGERMTSPSARPFAHTHIPHSLLLQLYTSSSIRPRHTTDSRVPLAGSDVASPRGVPHCGQWYGAATLHTWHLLAASIRAVSTCADNAER